MSKISAGDKKTIEQGILFAKKSLAEQNIDAAEAKLKSIEPVIMRTHYFVFQLAILRANIAMKKAAWDECLKYAESACAEKPSDALPWRIQLKAITELDDSDKRPALALNAMTKTEPNLAILQEIAPFLKDMDDEAVTQQFVTNMKALDSWQSLGFGVCLPETKETLDIRLELLKIEAEKSGQAGEELVWLYLNELKDRNEAERCAKMLPEENEVRLYIETLLGPDPVESARRHMQVLGSDKFAQFVAAADKDDIVDLKRLIGYEENFRSGWIYVCLRVKELPMRLNMLQQAVGKFPESAVLTAELAKALEESQRTDEALEVVKKLQKMDPERGTKMLISLMVKTGRASEIKELLSGDMELDPVEQALIDLQLYKTNHEKERLRRIIDAEYIPGMASAKAEAILELRDELGDKCESLFAATIRSNMESGEVFLFFAKYQELKGDKTKATFLYEKAVSLGTVNDDAVDLITRKLIGEEKLEDALALLTKYETPCSHFRAALIHQRLGTHMKACDEFQRHLRQYPDDVAAWKALAQSYMALNRAMSAKSVTEQLTALGSRDVDLEWQLSVILNEDIVIAEDEDFHIEETPLKFNFYLTRTTSEIQRFRGLMRKETCEHLITCVRKHLDQYTAKWTELAAVHKACGDFYLESFLVTGDAEYSGLAIRYFKSRAEKDNRAESFIDLAVALNHMGQIEMSMTVLRRALKAFPDHFGLWMNLGVAFALTGRYAFARHCLCVAMKRSGDIEKTSVYTFCAVIGRLISDEKLSYAAIDTARKYDQTDPYLWTLLAELERVPLLDASLLSFEMGPSPEVISVLPDVCLSAGRNLEGLGYALLSRNDDLIAKAYEANGCYEMAMHYTKDDTARQRLMAIMESDVKAYPLLSMFKEGKMEEAAHQFAAGGTAYDHIAAGIIFAHEGKSDDAVKELTEAKTILPTMTGQIDKIMLRVVPKTTEVKSDLVLKDSRLFFLQKLRRYDRFEAADATAKQFASDEFALTVYVAEALRSNAGDDVNDTVIARAVSLFGDFPSTRSLCLLIGAYLRGQQQKEALRCALRMCVMRPGYHSKLKPLISRLVASV